jgi:hypothetical protein
MSLSSYNNENTILNLKICVIFLLFLNFDEITAIVQNCEVGAILGLARSDLNLIQCIE